MSSLQTKVRTPIFPLYSEVRKLLPIWKGLPKADILGLSNALAALRGTPQNPVDWTHPDTWIRERLSGNSAVLAERIWLETDKSVNPRHIYGSYLFINGFKLLIPDNQGVYAISDKGQAFLNDDEPVVRELDEVEGLPYLLSILATKPQAKRADLVEEWGEFLHEYSNYGTASTIKDTLRRRILNLIERGYIDRNGNVYSITQKGIEYAAPTTKQQHNPKQEMIQGIHSYNTAAQEELLNLLGSMDPYAFEHIIRDLLEAMGYEDVIVTQQSGDKGVDVIAKVQFGITTITEAVQVKRYQSNIQRPVIDQLRGSLVYHEAIRGTIITLGGFSSGAREAALFPNAAPITLIDGDKLLELLVEHEVGIRKRQVELYEVDTQVFDAPDPEQVLEEVIS